MRFGDLFERYATAKPRAYGALYDGLSVSGSVLEAGVKSGGSLLAWADNFPDSQVVGVDTTMDAVRPEVHEHPRVRLVVADASRPEVREFLKDAQFGLVVDDAGYTEHTLDLQRAILENLAGLVASGGYYVVEDVTSELSLTALIGVAAPHGLHPVDVLRPAGLEFRVLALRRP